MAPLAPVTNMAAQHLLMCVCGSVILEYALTVGKRKSLRKSSSMMALVNRVVSTSYGSKNPSFSSIFFWTSSILFWSCLASSGWKLGALPLALIICPGGPVVVGLDNLSRAGMRVLNRAKADLDLV